MHIECTTEDQSLHVYPGAQCFLAQMNVQRAEMLERLSTARNLANLDDTDNYTAANKAVRQVSVPARGSVHMFTAAGRGSVHMFRAPRPNESWMDNSHRQDCKDTPLFPLHVTPAFLSVSCLQVIHQLKRLGTVWKDVLPVTIYCKAMGTLLNTAISEVMAKIMMLEVKFLLSFTKSFAFVSRFDRHKIPRSTKRTICYSCVLVWCIRTSPLRMARTCT